MTTISDAIQSLALTLSQQHYPQSYLSELQQFLELPNLSTTVLSQKQRINVEQVIYSLCHQKPIEYIVNRALFLERYFYVDERVLIPRFDSEQLALFAVDTQQKLKKSATIIDIGTGSGALICSIALELQTRTGIHPHYIGLDISSDALDVARKNISAYSLDKTIALHMAKTVPKSDQGIVFLPETEHVIIVTNPPYLSVGAMNALPISVKSYEPTIALAKQEDFISDLQSYLGFLIAQKKIVHLAIEYADEQGKMIQRFANSFQGDLPGLLSV
jgi:release factor glutamine methyltransferase